jgi:hypothetical protein
MRQLAQQKAEIPVVIPALADFADDRSYGAGENQKYYENDGRQDKVGEKLDGSIEHSVPTLPGVGQIDFNLSPSE